MPPSDGNKPITGRLLLTFYLPTGLVLLAVFLASLYTDTPVAMFTRDPADITRTSPFLGVISNIGILLWCATATICFFSAIILKGGSSRHLACFFLLAGILTGILLLDDLFLLHERVYTQFFHWRQRYILLTYILLVLGYLLRFRDIILRSNYLTLLLALGFFALSEGMDVLSVLWKDFLPFHHLYEDGFKLFGLSSWLAYFGHTAGLAISREGLS